MEKFYERANELANQHWEYIENLLVTHNVHLDVIEIVEFHYKSAFIHGYKHAFEERNKHSIIVETVSADDLKDL